MSNRRCCARCRTPYNCGNPFCRCHPADPAVEAQRARIAHEAATVRERFDVDWRRGNRNPDQIPGAEK